MLLVPLRIMSREEASSTTEKLGKWLWEQERVKGVSEAIRRRLGLQEPDQ
jgi:hypothetical protein